MFGFVSEIRFLFFLLTPILSVYTFYAISFYAHGIQYVIWCFWANTLLFCVSFIFNLIICYTEGEINICFLLNFVYSIFKHCFDSQLLVVCSAALCTTYIAYNFVSKLIILNFFIENENRYFCFITPSSDNTQVLLLMRPSKR